MEPIAEIADIPPSSHAVWQSGKESPRQHGEPILREREREEREDGRNTWLRPHGP